MKHPLLVTILSLLILLAAGCAGMAEPSPTQEIVPGPTETAPTVTLSPTPNRMNTLSAAYDLTATVRAKTPTKTSSPTVFPQTRHLLTSTSIPTIRPTFDYSKIQTNTPAPAARCPQTYRGVAPTPAYYDPIKMSAKPEDVLVYLNAYGPEPLIAFHQKTDGPYWTWYIIGYADYTNDGVRDLAFGGHQFSIFGCQDGRYVFLYNLFPFGTGREASIILTLDANRNAVPELLLFTDLRSQSAYKVIEWDGNQFHTVLQDMWVYYSGHFEAEDIDRDGYIEYVIYPGIGNLDLYRDSVPLRDEKIYFRWNGKEFIGYKEVFAPPEYRFQAVQDGDRALVYGEIEQALDFYRQVIYSDTLGWWSPDREQYIWNVYVTTFTNDPTPSPPTPDPVEYDNLAAYARFKLMVIYVSRGWHADAKIMFDNIQRLYPEDKVGHPYAELASVFWNEYEPSRSIAAGCLAANDFASSHEREILYYIQGAGGFASNRISYEDEPWYICPFR
jgi:hypothetical protein